MERSERRRQRAEVARRLRRGLGPGEVLARLGGDEFVVLTTAGTEPEGEAFTLAERRMLRLGCGLGQGSRFGRPCPDSLEALGKAGRDLSGSRVGLV